MNNRAKCPVTNIVEILMNVKWYGKKNFKTTIHIKDATSGTIIVPASQGWLRVQANTKKRYIDILCFYSLHFMFTLLFGKKLPEQVMTNILI